ncbi:hypothetical protein AAFN85_13730 [Mucilaginibacter sp. CAU 1740]|uniref:hypothetical protein n=1 Tax=Mucilaginibacter sp. CAU 1740 TaxID=3140365 RepID=UPI00325C0592
MNFCFKLRVLGVILAVITLMGVQLTYAQKKTKKPQTQAQPRKSEVYLVPTMDGYDTCFTVADAGKKWFFYNRRSARGSEEQNEYRSARKTGSGSIEVSYVTKSINRAGPGGAAHPETVVTPNNESTTIVLDSAVNRGLGTTLEKKSFAKADTFEYHAHGAGSLDTMHKLTPMLRYDNPKTRGRQFVKFDGIEGKTLIDRKLNVAGSEKALNQIKRVVECLNQNPGYTVRYEVPADRLNATKGLIMKALGKNDPRLSVVATKYASVPK